MAEVIKVGDTSFGLCNPVQSPFATNLASDSLVFLGINRLNFIVLGDSCVQVDCDLGPGVSLCTPEVTAQTCSPNVFVGPNRLKVALANQPMTCGYTSESLIPVNVIVN